MEMNDKIFRAAISDCSILDELDRLGAEADEQDAVSDFESRLTDLDDDDPRDPTPAAAAPVPEVDDDDDDDDLLREYESGALPRYSHDGLAFYLGQSGWNRDAKFVAGWSSWLFFDGSRWRPDDNLTAFSKIRTFLRSTVRILVAEAGDGKAGAAARKVGETILAAAGIAAVEKTARSNPRSMARIEDFDRDIMLLGTPAGTVDLRTGEMRPARREDMISKSVSVSPAPAGTEAPQWLAFLDQVFGGDNDVISFVQRALGYALTGSIEEHKLVFFYGAGRNGKGTILNLVYSLLGDYSRKAPVETFLKKVSGHPTDVAGLAGARFVIGSEIPDGMTWNEAMLKDLTGGDELAARFMRGDFFDFMPQMTLFLQGNSQPNFRRVDRAIRERMVLVPFKRTFEEGERDTRLMSRLIEEEGPAIMRWIVDGAVAWYERARTGRSGLSVPAQLQAESREYFDREDEMGQFLSDETAADPRGFVSGRDIYERWKTWNDARGGEMRSQREVMKEIRSRGYADKATAGARGLAGLRLLDDREKYERAAMSDDAPAPVDDPAHTAPF